MKEIQVLSLLSAYNNINIGKPLNEKQILWTAALTENLIIIVNKSILTYHKIMNIYKFIMTNIAFVKQGGKTVNKSNNNFLIFRFIYNLK